MCGAGATDEMALELDVRVTTKQMCTLSPVGQVACDPTFMHLLHCLFFMEAWFQFELVAVHIPGTLNTRADDLSHDRLCSFFSKAPEMDPKLTAVPPETGVIQL